MKSKKKIIKTCIQLFLLFGFIGTLGSCVPYKAEPIDLIVTWLLSLILAISGYFNQKSPSIKAEFIGMFAINNLLFGGIVHNFRYVFNGWLWVIPYLIFYLLAWILPWIDSPVSRKIRDEFYQPKTRAGKIFYGIGLIFLGSGGLIGGQFGRMTVEFHREDIFVRGLGILLTILTFVFAFTYSYYFWDKWKNQNNSRPIEESKKNDILD